MNRGSEDDLAPWNDALFATMALDEPSSQDRARVAKALGLAVPVAGVAAGIEVAKQIAQAGGAASTSTAATSAAAASLTGKLAGVAAMKWLIATGIASTVAAGGFAWRHAQQTPVAIATPPRTLDDMAIDSSERASPTERASNADDAVALPSTMAPAEARETARFEASNVESPSSANAVPAATTHAKKDHRRARETPRTASPPSDPAPRHPTNVGREVVMVDDVRRALAAHDWPTAQSALASYRAEFPRGLLEQEATVLEIEIARAVGDDAKARNLARAFIGQHPESPLRERALRAARISAGD